MGCATPTHLRHPLLQEPSRGIYHEVQKGETLWRIAHSYHVSVDEVASVNKLWDPSQISPGQLLFIPASSTLLPPSSTFEPAPSVTRKKPSGSLQLSWPVQGRVISGFGQQTPLGKNRGIDLAAAEGSPVVASAAGTVSFSGEKLKGFGKTVIIDHGGALQTIYAHNQDLLVKAGETVQSRQPIARLGKSGRVQRPTLHFEVRRGNRPLDPMKYLSR